MILGLNYPTRSRALPPDADEAVREMRLRAHAPKTAAGLAKAGVPFAFSGAGLQAPADFVKTVARAVREGLAEDAAIRALTLDAAKIAGASDRVGSLEKGKIANVLVTTGDLFNEAMKVRYVFVDGKLKPEVGFYTVVRSVENVKPTQANYVDLHRHNCDTQHIAIGTGAELSGLKIEFQIRDEKVVVESPVGVHIPAGTPHTQRIIEGSGHFFNFVPKSNYNEGLI